jgi:dTDP-4-amino-4,6-dideoxy-D-galactose acyltransferase
MAVLRIERDEWLSVVIGLPSWKIGGIEATTRSADLKARMLDNGFGAAAFISTKIPTRDVAAVANATRAGFRVIDVNVTFDWAGAKALVLADSNGGVTVDLANADDAAAIEDIAARCFRYTRFHLDPEIALDQSNEIKRQWARNSCRGRATSVYVSRQDSKVTGFLAVLEIRSGTRADAIIDLVGVDAKSQGRGVGRALTALFVDQWQGRADRLRVGTQVSNVPAMRLYEAMGFRVTETAYVLHAHVRNGAIAP